MSSDESDHEPDHEWPAETAGPCRVARPVWRADTLDPWLRVFDAVYLAFTEDRGAGHKPHLRIYNHISPKISQNKKIISHLPINAYNADWLQQQPEINFSVRPHLDHYEFRHETGLFE